MRTLPDSTYYGGVVRYILSGGAAHNGELYYTAKMLQERTQKKVAVAKKNKCHRVVGTKFVPVLLLSAITPR
jgi:hypothetical protein